MQTGKRAVNMSHEPANEPRSVLSLEGDLRVVDEDGSHEPASGPQPSASLAVAALGREADAIAAAWWPDITADSIVAGSPVSIQSPASSNPSTAVRVPGRGGASGASENVERFSRTARLFQSCADRAAGSASRTSPSAIAVS